VHASKVDSTNPNIVPEEVTRESDKSPWGRTQMYANGGSSPSRFDPPSQEAYYRGIAPFPPGLLSLRPWPQLPRPGFHALTKESSQ
jgi:hypothetical protein